MKSGNNFNYDGRCDGHNPVIAAIDLGTNSCRLLVASVNVTGIYKSPYRGRPSSTAWKIIDSYGKTVNLGEGLHENDYLTEEAMDRALEALAVCKRKMDHHGVNYLRAVATEACRRATNAHELAQRVKTDLGITIEVISSEEEARLALTGCAAVLNPLIPYAIIFDIGGGSTEIIFVSLEAQKRSRPGYPVPFKVIDSTSIPYGVVTTSNYFKNADPLIYNYELIKSEVYQKVRKFVELNQIPSLVEDGQIQLVGSSGTVTTLMAIMLDLPRYDRKQIDGVESSIETLLTVCRNIVGMTKTDRLEIACIGEGREDLVMAGSAIFEGLATALAIPQLKIADRGVREGILSEILTEIARH